MFEKKEKKWGGKRNCSGRKKTCLKKVPFNRRIDECVLKILREYAFNNSMTETEALESAILLQSNIYKQKTGGFMKIVIPTENGRLCGHFGHCESFTFVEVNTDTKEIISIEERIPEEGISCQSANWISAQGANIVLAGGMGGRPINALVQNGVQVVLGCPELPIREVVEGFINNSITYGENTCGGEHLQCHGHHGHDGHCHHE